MIPSIADNTAPNTNSKYWWVLLHWNTGYFDEHRSDCNPDPLL
jgi:hypothetical protein